MLPYATYQCAAAVHRKYTRIQKRMQYTLSHVHKIHTHTSPLGVGGSEAYNVCVCASLPLADDEIQPFQWICVQQRKHTKLAVKLQIILRIVARTYKKNKNGTNISVGWAGARGSGAALRDELWNSTMHTIRRVSLLIVTTRKLLSARMYTHMPVVHL